MAQDLTIFQKFEAELSDRAEQIAMQLPPNMPKEKFMATLLTAARARPTILTDYDRRNLFAEVMKAANDGIPLDGKHGALVPRKNKRNSNKEELQYQPMSAGIRKRAWELDRIILDAKCVREGDDWEHEEGDDAYIKHKPLPPWKGKRGGLVAVFVIIRQFPLGGTEQVLHREVMFRDDVMAVKAYSKQQEAAMWTTLEEEGWEKSVIHRGIKSVPCSSGLQTILARDYENFDFERDGGAASGPFAGLPTSSDVVPLPPPSSAPAPKAAEKKPAESSNAQQSEPPKAEKKPFATEFLDRMDAALAKAKTINDAKAVYAKGDATIENREKFTDADRDRAYAIWDKHEKRLTPAKTPKKKAAA